MTITDYTGSRFQSAWLTTAEKEAQKDEGKTGKTQQSATSASLDQVDMGEDGIAISEVSRLQGADSTGAQKQQAAPRMDTVEISAEGRAASAKLQTQQAETAVEESAAASSTESLADYTDAELKQMYYKGEITLQEYEDETGETLE